jgi:tRNA(Ile)-lysidine synthase
MSGHPPSVSRSRLSRLARRVAPAFPPGTRVLAACSGGADSLALVLLLDELRRDSRLDVTVAHVHHGLRGEEADRDLDSVRRACESLGLPFRHRRADAAAAAALRRRGLEEAARHVRRDALEQMRAEAGCEVIALAHTADDQAETVLLRLLRGSGAEGLGAMPSRRGHLVRPLLQVRRHELRAHLHAAGWAWSSDESNWSPASARALIRELLERLEVAWDERVVTRLGESADQLRADSEALDEQARSWIEPRLQRDAGPEGVPLLRLREAGALAELSEALRLRVLRRLLRTLRPDEPPPSAATVRSALGLLATPPHPVSVLLPGVMLRRERDDVVAGPGAPRRLPTNPLPLVAGEPLPWAGGVLRAALLQGDEGTRGRRRVSALMASARVPSAWRAAHPLVCLEARAATIVWLAGLEADPRFLAAAGCTSALELRWSPPRLAAPPPGEP